MERPSPTTTPAEYLQLDEAAEGRLELLNGVVVAMAGASPRHNLLVTNVATELRQQLSGEPCLVFAADQRVRIAETRSYVYPDVVVCCGEPTFDTAERPASLENPTLLVEVLSPATIDHDLGAKLDHYRRLPSVEEILFLHTSRRAATHVTRQDDCSWRLVDLGPSGSLPLHGAALTFDSLYAGTERLPG